MKRRVSVLETCRRELVFHAPEPLLPKGKRTLELGDSCLELRPAPAKRVELGKLMVYVGTENHSRSCCSIGSGTAVRQLRGLATYGWLRL